MQVVYLSTDGDTTTRLSNPLEVQGYGCAVVEISGKIVIPKRLQKPDKIVIDTLPQPHKPLTPLDSEGLTREIDWSNRPPLDPIPEPPPQNLTLCNDEDDNEYFSDNLFLCSNIIEESYIGSRKMPILRYLNRKNGNIIGSINQTIWLKVMRPHISSIRLYIADESGKILSLPRNYLNCTLLFIPHTIN